MTLLGTRKGSLGLFTLFALAACAVSAPSTAFATPLDTLVSTYTSTSTTNGYIGMFGARTVAVSFLTGSEDFDLSAFTARVFTGNPNDKATLTATLFADDGSNRPGSVLTGFSDQFVTADGDAIEDVRFTTSSAYTLTGNTKYWVSLKVVSGQDAYWEMLSSGGGNSGSGTVLDSFSVNDDGSSWESQSGTNRFAVEGVAAGAAAAPEPGSIALLLTAGVPVVGIVRRRAKPSTSTKCQKSRA